MKAVENFIQQIVSTGLETIDKSGFIVCKVTNSNKPLFLRELVLPEDVFIDLETKVKQKFGQKGLLSLYVAGKKFGYNYSKISDFIKYNKSAEKEFVEFFEFFLNYMKSWWTSDYKYRFDFEKKSAEIEFFDYLICRKTGVGKIIKEGCMAGFLGFLFNDKTIESMQITCQGRGAKSCKIKYAPAKDLKLNPVIVKEDEYDDLMYNQLNAIKALPYSKNSLKDLMYSKFVSYEQGICSFNGFRHFLIGSDFLYDIEEEMKKLDGGEILYSAAKKFGEKIVKNSDPDLYKNFGLLSAFGWGDFFISSENNKFTVTILHYPWFQQIKDHDCKFISGMLSGILSGTKKRDINLRVFKKEVSDRLDVVLKEF